MLVRVNGLDPVFVSVIRAWVAVPAFTRPKSTTKGAIFTVPPVTMIFALAVLLVSATEVAVSTTEPSGTLGGAVNVVASSFAVVRGATVPHPGEQATPACVRDHVTPLPAGSFWTVAVNCWLAITPSKTEVGPSDTLTAGGTIVMVADADFVVSVTEIAASVTDGFAGTVAGAV